MNGSNGTGLSIPQSRPYLVSGEVGKILRVLDNWQSQGRIVNILVRGKQGCGKSELVTQYAASRNRPLAVLEVGRLSDSKEIFGWMDVQGGSLSYRKGLFTEAITTPGAVIHLQELNRSDSDKALNAIFSILDDTFRQVWMDELGGFVKVAKGVAIFASLNEGFEFIGTRPLDTALLNRFQLRLDLGYLPQGVERNLLMIRTGIDATKAEALISGVARLRANPMEPLHISTRDTINIANLLLSGLTEMEAFKAALGTTSDLLESVLLQSHLSGKDLQHKSTDTTYQLL